MMKWKNAEYMEMPDFNAIISFIDAHLSIPIIKPFIQKLLIPAVYRDICHHKFESLKSLFERIPSEVINTDRDYIFLLEEATKFQYSTTQLADMVLVNDPNHTATLQYVYSVLARILSFSIHEIPAGVLCGMNGADLMQITYLKKDLQKFRELSDKLNHDHDKEFIQYCDTMYSAYADYLEHRNQYENFEIYLVRHNIEY